MISYRHQILYLSFEYVSIFLNAYRFSLKEKKTFVRWFIIGGRTTNEKREKWRQNWPFKRSECSINETASLYGSNRCNNDINHSNVSQLMTNCNDIKGYDQKCNRPSDSSQPDTEIWLLAQSADPDWRIRVQ